MGKDCVDSQASMCATPLKIIGKESFSFGSDNTNFSRGVKLLSHDYCGFICPVFLKRKKKRKSLFNDTCDMAQRKPVSFSLSV